jgi:hypothetical protein
MVGTPYELTRHGLHKLAWFGQVIDVGVLAWDTTPVVVRAQAADGTPGRPGGRGRIRRMLDRSTRHFN